MDQIYIISAPLEAGTDTRNLIYRYGRFVYEGPVITEPVLGLEYLPGVLQGIQAVQGQIPYVSEVRELPADGAPMLALAFVDRALQVAFEELGSRLEGKLGALVASGEHDWLEDEDSALYFELETLPGYSCNGADVVFAKTYRGEIMLNLIWYAHTGCFYVTLTPVGGAEQALVDTRFPTIYGKQRGVMLHSYDEDKGFTGEVDAEADAAWALRMAARAAAELEGGKKPDEDGATTRELLRPTGLLARASVWLSDGDVPDPDAIRARDEAMAAVEDDDEADGDEDEEGKAGEEAAAAAAAGAGGRRRGGGGGASESKSNGAGGAAALEQATVDVSGGNGYTQVYIVMQPAPAGHRAPLEGGGVLTTRAALFRFGSWVYGGHVDFPVDVLRLGDVPYVLPALQKQQGRLAFLSEATAFPAGHALCGVIADFMAAVGVLRHEMEDAQSELQALAEHSVNAWIDADWAASFFELSFQPSSITGSAARGAAPGAGLLGAEVIACKIYLYEGTGIILHTVWFAGSLFCVLSDSVEDLPLLDVAFPDVTARNRVVQVRSYEERTARKLAAAFPGAPLPKSLRVWEGRRKGVAGVGHGAASAFSAGDAASAAEAIRQRARDKALAAEAEAVAAVASGGVKAAAAAATAASDSKAAEDAAKAAKAKAAASAAGAGAGSGAGSGAAGGGAPAKAGGGGGGERARGSEGKRAGGGADDDDDEEGLYDVSGLKQSLAAAPRREAAGGGGEAAAVAGGAGAGSASAPGAGAGAGAGAKAAAGAMPTQLFNSVARAPHHVAPINRGGPLSGGAAGGGGGGDAAAEEEAAAFGRNRLVLVGGAGAAAAAAAGAAASDSKDADAPWDASGKPRARA